ncbi:clathrin adaptor complex small chain-domain-containing protein [Butyriboletus roseoflavus]|nr:clathrin adaptor complex small chain-domain-containing protein [Butyriboletus roseoflavus]
MAPKAKAKIVKDVTQLVLARRTRMCNFLEYKDTKVVYRRYASLFFVCGIGSGDNELITLEIIHRYVEVLDRYFGNVRRPLHPFSFEKPDRAAVTGVRAGPVSWDIDWVCRTLSDGSCSIFNFQKAYAVGTVSCISRGQLTRPIDPGRTYHSWRNARVLEEICFTRGLFAAPAHHLCCSLSPQVTQSDSVEEQEGGDDIMGRLAARSG